MLLGLWECQHEPPQCLWARLHACIFCQFKNLRHHSGVQIGIRRRFVLLSLLACTYTHPITFDCDCLPHWHIYAFHTCISILFGGNYTTIRLGLCNNSIRKMFGRCRKRGTLATGSRLSDLARWTRARQHQSFSRKYTLCIGKVVECTPYLFCWWS